MLLLSCHCPAELRLPPGSGSSAAAASGSRQQHRPSIRSTRVVLRCARTVAELNCNPGGRCIQNVEVRHEENRVTTGQAGVMAFTATRPKRKRIPTPNHHPVGAPLRCTWKCECREAHGCARATLKIRRGEQLRPLVLLRWVMGSLPDSLTVWHTIFQCKRNGNKDCRWW